MDNIAMFSDRSTSFAKRVDSGWNVNLVGEQNSEERRKPKKAVVKAAHIISLSCSINEASRNRLLSTFISSGVIGLRFGRTDLPLTRLIPRINMCSCCK